MIITKTEFDSLLILKYKSFEDSRGLFFESYRFDILNNHLDKEILFCQDNVVKSHKNVLRGLHFQNPNPQSKLITVLNGKILDVAVDIRPNSKTYGKVFSIELSKKNKTSLFIPKGFAHGYLSLENNTIVHYKVDDFYNRKSEKGIRYDDPKLKINWGINSEDIIISIKDKNLNNYKWIQN